MNQLAPIAFFCFNRADKTRMVLESLAQNDLAKDSELFIFCDGARNIREVAAIKRVHEVVEQTSGFKKIHIIKKDINHGLKNSIIAGVNDIFQTHEKVIVIEDDLICAKNFLTFVNQGLDFYQDEKNVWCVTGFNFPKNILTYPKNYHEDIFFLKGRNCSWGWGSWKDRWQKIDFEISDYDEFSKSKSQVKKFNQAGSSLSTMLKQQKQGKIDSWAIAMTYAMFKNDAYTVHPIKTLVKNIGFDLDATHTTSELDLANFNFEEFSNFRFKKLSEIPDNCRAASVYIKFHRDPFFLIKWAKSQKKRRNFKWLFAGALLGGIISYLVNNL